MKIVPFSINSLMHDIDNDYIEDLYFQYSDESLKNYSKHRIYKNVMVKNNTHQMCKSIILNYKIAFTVIVILMFSCFSVYATCNYLSKSSLIDEGTRNLIGTEINDTGYYIYKDGICTNEKGEKIQLDELCKSSAKFPQSRILKSSQVPNFIPSSIIEIPTKQKKDLAIGPELILVNNSVCIFTKDNGAGWTLSDKNKLTISFTKYKSDIVANQRLLIGYIKDGIMYEGEQFDEINGNYNFSVPENGEYYFYLLSVSSDYLSLKESKIKVE